jgi:hypothetical protein
LKANDVVVNSEAVLNDWLNSYEYHRDKDKKQLIDALQQIIPLEAVKAILLGLLADKAKAIYALVVFIRGLLGSQTSVSANL